MRGGGPQDANHPESDLREVAGYHLLRHIGEGGMSSVYLSYDVAAECPVAVKLLADHLAHSREFVGRFYREARLSRLLSHPNLIRGLAAGYDPASSKHYLILEFIDGPSGHTILAREGRFPVGVAVQAGIDIARALEFLHSRRYVHRDIKPDNILFHASGIAKLADLGLTKRLNDDPQLTSTTQGVGTSFYMAYEQALNSSLVDGRSDIFALGATLYHFLTGQVPFAGATHEEVIREKEQNIAIPARRLNPEIPPELADILAATLARDPRARIQTATELITALESTRLASPIPTYAAGDCAGAATGSEMPTRADLPLLDNPGAVGFIPPVSGITPYRTGRLAAIPSRNPLQPRVRSKMVLGLMSLIMLGGLGTGAILGTRSALRPKPKCDPSTATQNSPDCPPVSTAPTPLLPQ